MTHDHNRIRKTLIFGGELPVYIGQKEAQPLCQIYKQQQQPPVSIEEIAARLEALRQKLAALRP
jgi:hypothetical protein